MQSLSLTLSKRLSNSKSLFRISSNLVAHSSSATASFPSPPTPAPSSATQSRRITLSGSDVRVGNLIGNRGRAHEVVPHSVAGYATAATTKNNAKREGTAWRENLSKNIKELRFLMCQSSPASSSARDFVKRNYKELKTLNPKLPILIRECSGVEPQLWARYDLGVEKGIKLEGLSEAQIFEALEDLVKAGQS